MKKNNSLHSMKNSIFETKSEYYKNIGKQAAIFTFTKKKFSHRKLQSISSSSKNISKIDEFKKLENDTNLLLS